MIYLFEDRKNRKDKYLVFNDSVDKKLADTYISDKIFDCKKQELKDYINNNFSDADLILLHNSYRFPQNEGKSPNERISINNVQNCFNDKNISVFVFSGGFEENNLIPNGNILNGNVISNVMYYNLPYFLEQYEQIKINGDNREQLQFILPSLLYGKHYLRNSLISFQNEIVSLVFDKNKKELISKDRIIDKVQKKINTILKSPELTQDVNEFKSKLSPDLTIQDLLEEIQNLINRN